MVDYLEKRIAKLESRCFLLFILFYVSVIYDYTAYVNNAVLLTR